MANSNPLRCRSINIYLELNTAPNASISPVRSRPPMDFRREKKESPESRRAKWGLRLDTRAAWPTSNWQESNGFLWSTHEEDWLTLCNWYLTQYWMMRGKILKMCHNRTDANWHQEKYLFNNYDLTYFSQSIANSCFLYYNYYYVHTITSILSLSHSYFKAIFCRLSTFFDLFSLLELTKIYHGSEYLQRFCSSWQNMRERNFIHA